jgi:hypothetical protein
MVQQCNLIDKATYPEDVILDGKVIVRAGNYFYKCCLPKHDSIFHDLVRITEAEYKFLAPILPASDSEDEWAI